MNHDFEQFLLKLLKIMAVIIAISITVSICLMIILNPLFSITFFAIIMLLGIKVIGSGNTGVAQMDQLIRELQQAWQRFNGELLRINHAINNAQINWQRFLQDLSGEVPRQNNNVQQPKQNDEDDNIPDYWD